MEAKIKKKLTLFQKMQLMSPKGMGMYSHILNVESNKKVSKVTIQVDKDEAQAIAQGIVHQKDRKIALLFIIDENEFNSIK